MSLVKLEHGTMAMWVVCAAIGKENQLIETMEATEDGLKDIKFSVGGVELDFMKVVQRIDEEISKLITLKAQRLLADKYGDLEFEINDIQERIKKQKERFKYSWEELENGER